MSFDTDLQALNELSSRLGSDFGRHEINQISTAAKALADLAASGKSEQHITRTTAAAQRFQASLKRAHESLGEREAGGRKALAEARRERLGMATDKAFLPIVTAFQNAPDTKTRLAYLAKAVESGDGRVLAALAETPDYVTGIDSETLNMHLLSAESKHAPDLAERRKQFESDRQVVTTALQVGESLAAKAVDLESIQAAAQADAAEAALNDATA